LVIGLIKQWKARRSQKKDIVAALEECAFQDASFLTFLITVRAAQSDPGVGQELQKRIVEYLLSILSALMESEMKIYGFRGGESRWADGETAIQAGDLMLIGEWSARIGAANIVQELRESVQMILFDVESEFASPEETVDEIAKYFQMYRDDLAAYSSSLLADGENRGLLSANQGQKIRFAALKKVSKFIPDGER